MILEKINKPNDIKKISRNDYDKLSLEIRKFLIEKVSETGGHLASNLGVVELTIAMHLSLEFPKDKVVWDVGHQSYTHKLLTGRKECFNTLRKHGGISGFPKRRESFCDAFDTGHSSTSISAGLGIVNGNLLSGKEGTVVSVIGDGALTGGMAFEALNNASHLQKNFIIVLNDNNMSISENVGGISSYLTKMRTGSFYNNLKAEVVSGLEKIPSIGDTLVKQIRKTKSSIKQLVVPGMFFEDMGLTYLGPVDGHNILDMITVFHEAKKLNHAVVVHVLTKKGRGYGPAEKYPELFHGVNAFNTSTGLSIQKKSKSDYTDVYSKKIVEIAEKNKDIIAITAAMPQGTGLLKFKKLYPERFFDVGIAEQHAVTFAAGLASTGLKPFVSIYSSFLQRAYDQILHDVCIQNLPVVFMIDRAGLVGSDGETHQGIFDLSYLSTIPNMNIFAPKNKEELEEVVCFASNFNAPLAIRYPRGEAYEGLSGLGNSIVFGKSEMIYKEKDIALFAVGSMVETSEKVREILKKKGLNVSLINARFVRPFDEDRVEQLAKDHDYLVTMEENVVSGGFGTQVLRYVNSNNIPIKVISIALPNIYIEHGNVDVLKKEAGIDADSIVKKIEEEIL